MIENEAISDFFGLVCLLLFVFANVYYPTRMIANQFKPWPKDVAVFIKKYLDLHMSINIVAFIAMTIHAYYSDERNWALYASLFMTVWLTLAGILMRSKQFSGDTKKQMRLIHTQQTIFLVWLILLVLGHLIA